ncbi:hypothetical protein [Salegentibacter sediminis]|uniref:hypothetical protein n=1 Tax=Salegentibacter sediminis TaxID=1930251 RepID=UPI0009BEF6D0|nr:hypothetical protein [Salegentibacter sediminis]
MQSEQEINPGNLSILKPKKAFHTTFFRVKPSAIATEIARPGYALYGLTEEDIGIAVRSVGRENSVNPVEYIA